MTHISIAYLVAEGLQAAGVPVNRKGLLWGSILPDADYILAPVASRFLAHRTVTHTPLWTAMVAGIMRQHWGFWSTWLGGLTHLAADELEACNSQTGHWSRLMWLFPFDLGRRPWKRCLFDKSLLPGPPSLGALLLEGPIVLVALFVAWRRRK
jgi:membrane-bound metal-dependent hydrolase YbcI (DUF457 family)